MDQTDILFSQLIFLARFFSRSTTEEGEGSHRQFRRLYETSRVEVVKLPRGKVIVESYQTFRGPSTQGVKVSPEDDESLLQAVRLMMGVFPLGERDIPANPEPYLEFVSAIRDFEHPTYDVEDRLEVGTLVLSDDAMRVARAAGCVIDIERLRAQARVPLPGSEERQATDALVAELNLTPS